MPRRSITNPSRTATPRCCCTAFVFSLPVPMIAPFPMTALVEQSGAGPYKTPRGHGIRRDQPSDSLPQRHTRMPVLASPDGERLRDSGLPRPAVCRRRPSQSRRPHGIWAGLGWARVYINTNSAVSRDSIRIQRMLSHEFGHVVGLGHPDEAGQNVEAVMNSRVLYNTLQPDDIAGLHALYPPPTRLGMLENPGPGSF